MLNDWSKRESEQFTKYTHQYYLHNYFNCFHHLLSMAAVRKLKNLHRNLPGAKNWFNALMH